MHTLITFAFSTPVLTQHLRQPHYHRNAQRARKSYVAADLETPNTNNCEHCLATNGENTYRPYEIYRSFHRLQGMPVGTPPIHVRINAVSINASNPDTENRTHHLRNTATTFDIIPKFATDPATLARLLAGQCVPAVVRTRTISWPLSPRATALVQRISSVHTPHFCLACVIHAVHLYRGCPCLSQVSNPLRNNDQCNFPGLSLYTRNCWHFADSVIALIDEHSSFMESV